MTPGPGGSSGVDDPRPAATNARAGRLARFSGRLAPIPGRVAGVGGRVVRWGPVAGARRVLDAYGDAGGGLLAAGLAFGAVFALVPATLFLAGLVGFVVADPGARDALVRQVATAVPPLEPFVVLALDQLAGGALAISIVGLVGFAWTASQFYGQLDGAFALVLRGPRRRDLVERTVRGLIALGLVIALFVDLLGVGLVATASDSPLLGTAERVLRLLLPVVGYGFVVAAVAFVYRIVPTRPVSWRAAWLPAVTVALLELLLGTLFVTIAPLLASPVIFGPFVTVFATLAWLSWTFQVLLIGGAWVEERLTRLETDAGTGAPIDPGSGRPAPGSARG